MGELRACGSGLLLACVWLLLVARPVAAEAPGQLRLVVEAPRPESVVASEDGRVFVTGRALRIAGAELDGALQQFDVIVAIDTSASTRAPAGADIDEDGEIGRMRFSHILPFLPRFLTLASNDPGDSILAAEVAAARTLLDQLDTDTTRVGVVAFAGDDYSMEPHARTVVPLTSDYELVTRSLDELLEAGPSGMTNIPHAIEVAAGELDTREDAHKIVLMMTDGRPTLPIPDAPSENGLIALAAASRAADDKIRIDTFAIGRIANTDSAIVEEMAMVTGGLFTPVRHPKDLVATFRGIRLAQVESLELRNLTTGGRAEDTYLGADGTFSGILQLAAGRNELEVMATSTDGIDAREVIVVNLSGEPGTQQLTGRLLNRKTRLLESKLAALRADVADKREQRLDELEAEIELVRAARERQKQLELEIEKSPPPTPSPQ